jgi:hypothetical protein
MKLNMKRPQGRSDGYGLSNQRRKMRSLEQQWWWEGWRRKILNIWRLKNKRKRQRQQERKREKKVEDIIDKESFTEYEHIFRSGWLLLGW